MMMTVLITNDDGIDSPGLHALARMAVDQGFAVTMAAPAAQSSGSSASIIGAGEDGRISFERREIDGLQGVPSYAVRAAPALISLIAAHGAFGAPPDIVLSGANRGANVGRAILHSGTVGAALTAGLNGARGLAVSLDVGLDPLECLWDAAQPFVASLLPKLGASPPGTVFNLNVPNAHGQTELREGTLAPFGIVQTTMTRNAERDTRLAIAEPPEDQPEGSDAALLALGFATVTNIVSIGESGSRVLPHTTKPF